MLSTRSRNPALAGRRSVGTVALVDDGAQVAAFWQRCLASGAAEPSTPVPDVIEPFGDGPEMADELLDLVVHGEKRATVSALVEHEVEERAPPAPGTTWIATDGTGRPRAVLRTTEVRIGALASVDERFAWDEAEGDRTRRWWLEAHERYLRRYLPTIGVELDPALPMVFERFEVLYAE